ncbi:hypothetical protein TRFO_22649 [Tritrichomonas foetus]|uniref:Uncharacterized protein n=1 Tax=Tritrichomonas foetus TaxID=1144522 RepID=A0A1J4KCU4_9EUKA|nr:hypothetical protein TRFO_22649 [Tritrichomonas foetus]|eukprot:OHT08794.1 hypothetical protein TRFO_22649 [Tritrichomonas foetus]
MEAIFELIDFQSPWIYYSFGTTLIYLVSVLLVFQFTKSKKRSNLIQFLLFLFLLVVRLADGAAFVEAIREQPIYDNGFILTVVVPTILLLFGIALFLVFFFLHFIFGFMTPQGYEFMKYPSFVFNIIQISFSMAHGNLAAYVLTMWNFVVGVILAANVPPVLHAGKMKKE